MVKRNCTLLYHGYLYNHGCPALGSPFRVVPEQKNVIVGSSGCLSVSSTVRLQEEGRGAIDEKNKLSMPNV